MKNLFRSEFIEINDLFALWGALPGQNIIGGFEKWAMMFRGKIPIPILKSHEEPIVSL